MHYIIISNSQVHEEKRKKVDKRKKEGKKQTNVNNNKNDGTWRNQIKRL